jgi:hypothetical protein
MDFYHLFSLIYTDKLYFESIQMIKLYNSYIVYFEKLHLNLIKFFRIIDLKQKCLLRITFIRGGKEKKISRGNLVFAISLLLSIKSLYIILVFSPKQLTVYKFYIGDKFMCFAF